MALRKGTQWWRNFLVIRRAFSLFILSGELALSVACQGGSATQSLADLVPPHVERFQQLLVEGWVSTLVFSHGGHTLIVGGCQAPDAVGATLNGSGPCMRGVVQSWDLQRIQLEATTTLPRAVTALAVSPDGSRWVAGDLDGRLTLSTSVSKRMSQFFYQKGKITALAFSPDGKWLVSGSLDPSFPLGFMDVAVGGAIKLSTKFEPVTALAFSPDAKTLAVGMAKGKLVVWEFSSNSSPVQVAPNSGEGQAITSATFSSDGRLLAYGRRNGRVVIFDNNSGHALVEFKGASAINALAFSPDGHYLALGQDNGKVLLVESARAREIWSKRHIVPVSDIVYSPDGLSLAVAAQNHVYLYRVEGVGAEQPPTVQNEPRGKDKSLSPTALAPGRAAESALTLRSSGKLLEVP